MAGMSGSSAGRLDPELLLKAIVDSSDDAILSKDLDGIITSWNKGAERLFGYSAQETIGRPITMLIPPDRIAEESEILTRIRNGTRIDHFETVRRRKDGTLIDISLTISPVRDAQGQIIGVSRIARDITEARYADRARQLLSAIVGSSEDAIVSKDLNGIITSWNKGAERLFGYTFEEAVGRSVTMLMPPDRVEEEAQILARIRRGERVEHFETIRRRKDGTLLDISLTISPVKDAQGVIIGASKIARNITQRKRAEAEIRRANRDLEQFAFSVSHDLQEPLRSIKIYSRLLMSRLADRLDGEELQFLEFLHNGANRMEHLITDLLAYTSSVQTEASQANTDANEVFREVVETLAGTIADSDALVSSDALPLISMETAHLFQVLQNLIANALKYRDPNRQLTVHVACQRQPSCYELSVADNGIGIAPQYKEIIFGLFKRLHTADHYSGTGIGLAICHRIVERYSGRIWVESELGRGSTFRFTVPL
jgi:PAS domain S-box-containing protein